MAIGYKELSPRMRVLRILTVAVMIIYSIVTLVLAIKSYTSLEQNVTIVQDTVANWKSGAIKDIIVSKNGSCPYGYQLAYSYYWAGTKIGCDCRASTDADFKKQGMHSGTCNNTEFTKACTAIVGYQSRILANWGQIGYDQTMFCVSRSNDTWAAIGPTQGTTCPPGKLKCGTSNDMIFCSSDSKCPVTSVSVSSTPCANCTQFDTSKYLNVQRGEDKMPLAEFRLNEYGMCYEANQRSRTHGRSYYFLYAGSTYDCNGEGNGLWNNFDSRTEANLFAINQDMTSVISYLSNYGYYTGSNTGASYSWYIFNRGWVQWNLRCRDILDDIINKSTDLSDIKHAHLGMLVVTIISTIVVGLVLTIMEILNLSGHDLPCIKGVEEEERQKLLRIKASIQLGVKLLLLPFQIWAIVVLNKVKDLILDVATKDCSSTVMNSLISNASDSLQNAFKSDVGAIVALLVLGFISVLQCCCISKLLTREVRIKVDTSVNIGRNDQNINDTSLNQSQIPLQNYPQQPFQQQPFILQQQYQQMPIQQTPMQGMPNQFQPQINPQQQINQMQPGFYPPGYQQGQPQGPQIVIKVETGPNNQQPNLNQ